MSRILTGTTVGEALRPRLTVDGLRELLADMRRAGKPMPKKILVNEYNRRELNQDLLAGSVTEVKKEDQRPEHDNVCIGIIDGVMIGSHPDVPYGQARLVYAPRTRSADPWPKR